MQITIHLKEGSSFESVKKSPAHQQVVLYLAIQLSHNVYIRVLYTIDKLNIARYANYC